MSHRSNKHILMLGPAGSGKTIWARQQTPVLPADLDTIYAHHVAQLKLPETAPFRAPHHTASLVGLEGKLRGHRWYPGELSLAHGGVLFLDELTEFSRRSLDAVRFALENGEVVLASKAGQLRVPADFRLIAAANDCPCGGHRCECTDAQKDRHLARIPEWLRERCTTIGPEVYNAQLHRTA